MQLEIDINESKPGTARISLDGALDSETSHKLETAVREVAADTALIVFDMQNLTFISSAGLRVVFSTLKKQKAKGGRVALSHMSPGVKKVFEIVKALPDFTVFSNVEELDEYLARMQSQDD